MKQSWDVQELKGTLYEYEHEKTGAKLLYMKTDDRNKLFSVAFRTTPTDDTGVFHILEHSVLCGSKNYPVREPFVELLKSSMNTFLNAMTFPDKTLYPVSSRNEKDFLNLTSVYLDAVFYPQIYENPNIFYQEGWHYDYPEKNGDISYKGVVFNEMKGAEASVDTLVSNEVMAQLFPDTCYKYISGGDPRKIPDLTYEQFLEFHRTYYSAANAIFYLEGDMDISVVVSMIEEYLQKADTSKKAITIESQAIKPLEDRTRYYAISEEEDEEEMTRISFNRILGDYSEKEKLYAASLISAYLTDSNEAPFKKAIFEKGLAQDVMVRVEDGIKQFFLELQLVNTETDRLDDIKAVIKELRTEFKKNGLDRQALEATLNNMEFMFRELMEPRSLYHNMSVLSSYLYGGDPTLYLTYDETFASLREKLDTDYFKELILEFLDLDAMGMVTLLPSRTLEEEEAIDEENRILDRKGAWSKEEEQEILEQNARLSAWQMTSDPKEALDTIPRLSVSDVEVLPRKKKTTLSQYKQACVLTHPSENAGISYVNMYFEIPKEYQDRLAEFVILSFLIGKLPTTNSALIDLVQEIKGNLGNLVFDMDAVASDGETDTCRSFFTVNVSALTTKLDKAKQIIQELLFETDFSQKDAIEQILVQFQNEYRDTIIGNGHQLGIQRASSGHTSVGYAREQLEGLSCYLCLKEYVNDFDNKYESLLELVDALRENILKQCNLTISITSQEEDAAALYPLINMFEEGEKMDTNMSFPKRIGEKCFVQIPAQISYACSASNITKAGMQYSGGWRVLAKISSLEYLWNEVRVQGGAYGVGMTIGTTGNLVFYSYRDPGAEKTYSKYEGTKEFLREFAKEGELDDYIISTVSATDPLLTPREVGEMADIEFLRRETYEDLCKERKEILNASPDMLREYADVMEAVEKYTNYCLVAAEPGDFEADVTYTI